VLLDIAFAGGTIKLGNLPDSGAFMNPIRPTVIAFDVIETLFALDPLADRFAAVGLPADSLRLFFASMLRDAFALEITGSYKSFKEIATASVAMIMANHGVAPEQTKIANVLDGFAELSAQPDVRPAFERIRAAGVRIITVTNGSAENTKKLLSRAGLADFVEKIISIDEIRHWKPHRDVYLHAARAAQVAPSRLALIAAHAWDTHGAKQAGLLSGAVQRQNQHYLSAMSPPDVQGGTLLEVVDKLLALPAN
jgi:2-haloacid dehalogenase